MRPGLDTAPGAEAPMDWRGHPGGPGHRTTRAMLQELGLLSWQERGRKALWLLFPTTRKGFGGKTLLRGAQ